MKSGVGNGDAQVRIYDARLDSRALVLDINFENPVHTRKHGDDAAVPRNRSAGEAGAGAASNQGSVVAICDLNNADNVRRIDRKNNTLRLPYLD